MTAYHWLPEDGYQYLLACNKEEAFEIIAHFGPQAKAPTIRNPYTGNIKFSFYVVNTRDRILSPYPNPVVIAGSHAGDWSDPVCGNPCTLALFLDGYRLEKYPFLR